MKKVMVVLLLCTVLCGCASVPTFEGVSDVYTPELPDARQVVLELPQAQVMESEAGVLYLCDGFDVTVQVLSGGDMDATVQTLTGFTQERLTVISTSVSDLQRYECAWSAAGEGGDQIARATVLDDGYYHYCITLQGPSQSAGDFYGVWQEIMDSVALQ